MARTQVRSSTRPHPATAPEREQRIRERAYLLWEADGGPHGRDVEYWERACELISVEEAPAGGRLLNSRTAPVRSSQSGAKNTAIEADPVEIPDRPASRDEAKTKPPPKRAVRSKPRKPA